MNVNHISHISLWNTSRSRVQSMQTELARLSAEVVTGRMADVGLDLGAQAARATELHIDLSAFDGIVAGNTLAAKRLELTDMTLGQFSEDADSFMQALVTSRGAKTPVSALANAAFDGFAASANAGDSSLYLFAGTNLDVPPFADYDSGPAAAVDAAFLARFGVAQDDPGAASITATDMADFLSNEFADLFADPAWGSTWSSAADQTIKTRISATQTAETSVSLNEQATRKLAMVYTMVAKLGTDGLGEGARDAIFDAAITALGEVTTEITTKRVEIGVAQKRITTANERLEIQRTMLEERVQQMEGVDPAEAKVRIDLLSSQIEMSYALTARIMRLSILNYA